MSKTNEFELHAVESGVEPPNSRRPRARPGGDPGGVDAAEVDTLFDLHIRYAAEAQEPGR